MKGDIGGIEVIAKIGGDGNEGSDTGFLVEFGGLQEADVPNHRDGLSLMKEIVKF